MQITYVETHPGGPKVAYELCWNHHEGTAMIYRFVKAGVCGPWSGHKPATTREEAEKVAFDAGYVVSGEWEAGMNYHGVMLTPMH